MTKELRGAREEDELSQQETVLTIGRAETIVVVQKRKKIVGEVTTAGEARKKSEGVQDRIEVGEAIEAETEGVDPMGPMRLVELSSPAQSLCPPCRKLRQPQCWLESR